MVSFNERLRLIRQERNLTQQDVIKNCGISLRAYRYYESEEREPTLGVLVSLADYFGVSIDYLTGRTDKPEVNK